MSRNIISKLDSYALIIIALLAVVVSIWQVRAQRSHDRISVMPYLEWISNNDPNEQELRLWNKGLGVAFITDFDIKINDKTFNSWEEGLDFADSTIEVKQSKIFNKYTLAPNEKITLVRYIKGSKAGNIQLKVSFESAYGDTSSQQLNAGI